MLHELGFIDPLFADPVPDLVATREFLLVHVDRGKYLPMEFVKQAHGFERVKQALLRDKIIAESHGDPPHRHILRDTLDPGIERWLKGIAVWAAVPEKLHHFDLVRRCLHRGPLVQHHVVGTCHWRLGLGQRPPGRHGRTRHCGTTNH